MVIEKKSKEKITISFSGLIGKKELENIKSYIEFLEAKSIPQKKVPQRIINNLSREINKKAWEKLVKKRGIKLQ